MHLPAIFDSLGGQAMNDTENSASHGTNEHARRLVDPMIASVAPCDAYSITCKPKMLSCDPVSQCMDFSSPGCEPLEGKPRADRSPEEKPN
jgi:hypothetical protein